MAKLRPIPVYWGNYHWFFDKNGRICHGKKIGSRNKNRVNYTSFGYVTAEYSKDTYQHHKLRKQLRSQIIQDILSESSVAASDEPFFFMFSGGTASGKSSLVEAVVQGLEKGSYIEINYDLIKKMIPEYYAMIDARNKRAAELVHFESVKITGNLFKKAIQNKYNIIYEFTLFKTDILLERIRDLKRKNYKNLALFYSFIDVDSALKRAEDRFKKTGRYVPIDYIKSSYQVVPKNVKDCQAQFNDVYIADNRSDKVSFILAREGEEEPKILDEKLHLEYVNIVGNENAIV